MITAEKVREIGNELRNILDPDEEIMSRIITAAKNGQRALLLPEYYLDTATFNKLEEFGFRVDYVKLKKVLDNYDLTALCIEW